MHSNYELLIEEDDAAMSMVVALDKSSLSIGRKPGNAILLGERNVSRHHARLLRAGDAVEIEDLNSYTGVLLNGQRITGRAPLHEGDRVQIGDYRLALRRVVQTAAAAVAQTALMPLVASPAPTPAPVRSPEVERRPRRVWLTLAMAGLGLVGGLMLNRQSPQPVKPPVAASTQAARSSAMTPQATPPLVAQGKPAVASDKAQPKAQPETLPLRRRSPQPRLHERTSAAAAAPKETSAVTASSPSPVPGEQRLEVAQAYYVAGDYVSAIRVARELTTRPDPDVSLSRAWRLIGAAACHIGALELVNEAYRRVDPVSRQYLQYVCEQSKVTRNGGRFELAR